MNESPFSRPIRRREALAGAGAVVAAAYGVREVVLPGPASGTPDCVLQREVTEGPYYLDLDLVRRDIGAAARARR